MSVTNLSFCKFYWNTANCPYLSIGTVDFTDHICKQNFILYQAVELLVLWVFGYFHIVSFERLPHTVKQRMYVMAIKCFTQGTYIKEMLRKE